MSTKQDAFVCILDPTSLPTLPGSSAKIGALDVQQMWASARTAGATKALESRMMFGPSGEVAALVSIGDDKQVSDAEKREVVRKAAGKGVNLLRDLAGNGNAAGVRNVGVALVGVDGDAHAAAVGAKLALGTFTLKTAKDADPSKNISVKLAGSGGEGEDWNRGAVYADAQNLVRELMELPANILTPTAFCDRIQKEAEGLENVQIFVRDEAWAREKGMNTFLSVAKGSNEPAKFLEVHYSGAPQKDARPVAFVGKGVTFDAGGISLKPAAGMKLMKSDMCGAANACATALAVARLAIPINVIAIAPLTENIPGPNANKPGDIVYGMNGKSVEIDNTDMEGRLILSDALYYTSTTYKPHTILDIATLTYAMQISFGEIFSGVFSTSDSLWDELRDAGEIEHDRFWRMPLDEEFGPHIYSSIADLCNNGGPKGTCCTAALFLKAFVEGIQTKDENGRPKTPSVRWAHLDACSVMECTRPGPYQALGAYGRPVRALIEFARRLA
ncbi:leucine aminopeptidase [Schizopora paradoxa]|uniref:Leucine aminopeptidase n=1 Tax=Schizopora paradoxa TaxID=27342 RepID=A0A0H2SHQ0_9AGAM|nr:leucine aminopeptidase [Schizopora paradoxa]